MEGCADLTLKTIKFCRTTSTKNQESLFAVDILLEQ